MSLKSNSMVVFLSVALGFSGCKQRAFNNRSASNANSQINDAEWKAEQSRRQAKLDEYLNVKMKEQYLWFRDFPVGNVGLPALFYRILPDLSAPLTEIWGTSDTKMAKLGLGPHPSYQDYPFPLGIGWTRAPSLLPVNIGVFSCGACHIGRVVGPNNEIIHLTGAPNTQFDAHGFTNAIVRTSRHPSFNEANVRKAIETHSQNPYWLYGREFPLHLVAEKIESKVFERTAEEAVQKIKASSEDRQAKIDRVLLAGPYQNEKNPGGSLSGGNPGRVDAFSTAIALLSHLSSAAPDKLVYDKAAMSDIMSVWGQGRRTVAQWDGSVRAELIRNLGAELGVVGDPERVDVKNAVLTSELLRDLPPPPYPFAVDLNLARQGEKLFATHCASCHRDNSDSIYSPEVIGTDPNRSNLFTVEGRKLLIAGLRKACPSSVKECTGLKDEDIVKASDAPRGYTASPLDGIWARAPYLHNGSVPTLMHLLVPELRMRPEALKFWRGNIAYDTNYVGFEWRTNKAPEGFSRTAYLDNSGAFASARLFDTSLEGSSNKGHDTILRNDGKRWSSDESTPEGKETRALLEYLKTL